MSFILIVPDMVVELFSGLKCCRHEKDSEDNNLSATKINLLFT